MKISEAAIIEGIKRQDSAVLGYVYKQYFPLIEQLIVDNNGNSDDAKDVFQESIVVLYRDINRGVELSCSVSTYLYAVAKRHWLRTLKFRRVRKVTLLENHEELIDVSEEHFDKSTSYLIYVKQFKKLSEDCQKILRLFFQKVPLSEIANIMGYRSVGYAKKRKHLCKERLVNGIRSDEEFEMHKLSKNGKEKI